MVFVDSEEQFGATIAIVTLNHSTKPNMRTRDGYNFIALRKIMVGEEPTVD